MGWGKKRSESPTSKTLGRGGSPGVPNSGTPAQLRGTWGLRDPRHPPRRSRPRGAGVPWFRGARSERARGRAGAAAPAHTWPPTPVAKGPSEPQRPLSLAPLWSRLTKTLTGKREGAHAAGIPPGEPHRCPRGSYLGSALRASALLRECHDLPRSKRTCGRGRKIRELERPPRPAADTPQGIAPRPAPSAPRTRLARRPGRVCAPLAPGYSQRAPRMPSSEPGTRAAPRGRERAPFARS